VLLLLLAGPLHQPPANHQAKLRVVPWDGYLKYYNLGEKHPQLIEKRRKVFAQQLYTYLPGGSTGGGSAAAAAATAGAAEPAAVDAASKKGN
jgi:glycerol-3-phosphate O-acyltransferase 3/4